MSTESAWLLNANNAKQADSFNSNRSNDG